VTTGTTLVTLKQQLRDALQALPGLASAQITYGYPGENAITGKDIWMADAESENHIAVIKAGTKKVDETLALSLIIQVLKTAGEGQEAADLEAVELFSEVQQLFARSPQISPSIMWAQIARWSHKTGAYSGNESSHGSRFEVTVTARARLGG
jgi:hypothetical protein